MLNDTINSGPTTIYMPHTFRVELTELHALYENILYKLTDFPKAGEVNWRVLEMVDQVMDDWALLGYGTTSEIKGLVEVFKFCLCAIAFYKLSSCCIFIRPVCLI